MAPLADSAMDADDAALATLVRMHEAHSSSDDAHDQQMQPIASQRDAERLAKAYSIVAAVAQDEDRFKALMAKKLQSETSVGRSAYTTELSFQALVQAVFWALSTPQDVREGEKLRATVFAQVLSLVHSANASSVAQRVVVLLLQELHKLRVTDLAIAVSEILRGVTHAQRSQHRGVDGLAVFYTIELLPQLLLRVSASMTLSFEVSQSESGVGDLSGQEYRLRVLTKLTSFVWPRRFFLQVLKSFRDMTLTQDEERLFCIKIYREARKELNSAADQVRTLEIFPTVSLHVLQLVGRTQNVLCTRLLTRLLINKCQQLTTIAAERSGGVPFLNAGAGELSDRELRALQSTVLYHVDMAMRQWERLGKAILVEYEQRFPQKLSSFDIALLLLVASHNKHEQPVMLYLLRYTVDTYNPQRTRVTDGRDEAVNRKAFVYVVQHAHDGNWTPIVQQMIALGFSLIEFRGLKTDHGNGVGGESPTSQTKSPGWVDFGIRLLLACFQYHAEAREKLLDRVVNMIIVQNADCRTYIHVVSRIVRRHIAELGGSLEARIRECLEYVTRMHPDHANSLLVALSPLLKTQPGLKSFVVLMLRKAMFRKDEGSRIIAIQGFALLLCLSSRIFSRNRTLSQLYSQNVTMLSQGVVGGTSSSMHHHSSALETDLASQEHSHALVAEDLYRQFCGIFRRGLELQTRVRLVLYAELIKVFTECPALQQSILGLLFQHYQKYYDFNETVQPPLRLDLSLSRKRGVYEEPLAYLLHAMLHCFLEMKKESVETEEEEETMMDDIPATQAGGSNQLMETMEQNISVLFERLKRCELSDFEFDKNSSFSSDSELGETNRRLARLVMGIMQVAMNWFVSRRDVEVEFRDSEESLMPEVTWDALLQYAQIYAWIERRLLDSDGSQKQTQPMKKIKLTKGPTKMAMKKPGRPSAGALAAAEEQALDSAFESSAQVQWATLLSPDSLLQILEFAANKAKGSDGLPSLSADEEDFVVTIAEKSTRVLDLVQLKLADQKFEDTKQQQQRLRHSSEAVFSRFDHARFTRRLGDVLLKLLRCYCNEEVSLTVPTGSTAKRRRMGEDNQSRDRERMRCLVRICVQGFARIVDMWSLQPLEEFEEQLIRALCISAVVDEDSPDYDLGGDEADGIVRALPPLQKLTEELLSHEMPDEAHRLLDVVQMVWSRSAQSSPSASSVSHAAILKQNTTWVRDQLILHSNQASAKLLEKLVVLLLRPHDASPFQSDLAEQLAKGLCHFCKRRSQDVDEDAAEEAPAGAILFRRLSEKSVLTVANAILSKIDEALVETEHNIKLYDKDQKRHAIKFKEDDFTALQKLEEETGSQVFSNGEGVSGGLNSAVQFKRMCIELLNIAGALTPFVAMNLDNPAASTRTVRLVGRLYKVLVLGVKDKLRRKDSTLPKFLRQLFDRTAVILSKDLLEFVAFIHDTTTKSGSGKKRAPKSNNAAMKNLTAKFIPDVIYQLEQFDVVMIKLSKLCKASDFSAWCKLRPVRDFRLNKEQVQKSLSDNLVKKTADADDQDTTQTMGGSDDDGGELTSEETVTEAPSTASGNEETQSAGEEDDDEPEVIEAPAPKRGTKRRAQAIEAAESEAEEAEEADDDEQTEEDDEDVEEVDEEEEEEAEGDEEEDDE